MRWAPRRRRWRIVTALLGVLVVAYGIAAYLLIVDPTVNRLRPADAVVVLGGASVDGRLQHGIALVEAGYASTLLVSQPTTRDQQTREFCARKLAHVTVVCFKPDPATTQGEAREIRARAAADHWNSVIVVTSAYHISRARLIISRCFGGTLMMTGADRPSLGEWTYNVLYQTGAFAKALVDSGC
jgi:uncharacterized SAM-binding protein YcdF (DUF218 family)